MTIEEKMQELGKAVDEKLTKLREDTWLQRFNGCYIVGEDEDGKIIETLFIAHTGFIRGVPSFCGEYVNKDIILDELSYSRVVEEHDFKLRRELDVVPFNVWKENRDRLLKKNIKKRSKQ